MKSGDKSQPRNAESWAGQITSLQLSRVPTGALNLNVEGRSVVGPLQGFGPLWQKTFRICLPQLNMTPDEIIQVWKTSFSSFTPKEFHFYPSLSGIQPEQIILINASMTGMPISTGMMVLYADEESFTLMTPQGHPESGWVTFSAALEEEGLVCQVQTLARANDPLYEMGFRLLGTRKQDRVWKHVLEALAAHFEMQGQVEIAKVCLDPRIQWREARNIWQNAAIRTILYRLMTPFRRLRRRRATPVQVRPAEPPEATSSPE